MVPTCLPAYTCPATLDDQSIILPAKAAGIDLTGLAGTDVTFTYQQLMSTNANGSSIDMQGTTHNVVLHVVGLYDPNDAKADGFAAAFVSLANATTWQAAYQGMTPQQLVASGYTRVYIQADSAEDAHAIVATLTAMGIAGTSYYALTHQLPQAFRLLQGVSIVLGVALLLVCLLVGTSLGSAIALSRRRIVGLLKAVGWTTSQIARSLLGEIALLGLAIGIIALVVGLGVGWGVTAFGGGSSVFGITVPASFALPSTWWLLGCLAGPVVATVLGALPRTVRTAGVAPDDALRDL